MLPSCSDYFFVSLNKLICFTLLLIHKSHSEELLRCGIVKQRQHLPLHYHLTEPCRTSTFDVLASKRASTLEECFNFTRRYHGMALSFIDVGNKTNFSQDTCLVFQCPEFNDETNSSKPMSEYNYYTAYPYTTKNSENVICIPNIGIFYLNKEKKNYSSAMEICVQSGGHLGLITTAKRTNELSTLIKSLGLPVNRQVAYVGLHDIAQEGQFISSLGEPLNCFDFLGWAPGEPRSSKTDEDCVVLDSELKWRVVSCQTELPFLCELFPAAGSNICSNVKNQRDKTKCMLNYILFQKNNNTSSRKCKTNPKRNVIFLDKTLFRQEKSNQLPNGLLTLKTML